MQILITGIAGFVGSYLTESLLSKNFNIYGTLLPGESLSNIEHLLSDSRLKLIECDIRNSEKVKDAISISNPDRIYHLAGQSSVALSFKNPTLTFDINILGTLNILEILRSHSKPCPILLVGSSDVYGIVSIEQIPIKETTPLKPVNPYAVSKATVELLGYQYYKCYNLPIIMTRSFSHIGPRQSLGFVISDFSSQIAKIEAKKQIPIITVGNLETKRDFMDVRDVINAYYLLIEKGKAGEVYNVCSGKAYQIKSMLERLISISTTEIKVEQDPLKLRPSEMPILQGDNTKICSEIGWKPEITIEETLKNTLDYWRNLYGVKK